MCEGAGADSSWNWPAAQRLRHSAIGHPFPVRLLAFFVFETDVFFGRCGARRGGVILLGLFQRKLPQQNVPTPRNDFRVKQSEWAVACWV